jgi:hypothetical protein
VIHDVVVRRRVTRFDEAAAPALIAAPLLDDCSAAASAWRRPLGLYVALGGVLAAFQHVVQRHVFQDRPLDVASGLVLAAYVVVGGLGLRWFRASRTAPVAPIQSPE